MSRILIAVKAASLSRTAVAAALVSFIAFLFLFVYSTIVTTPGNSLELWIQITPDESKALVFFLAAALGVLFGLLAYSFRQKASIKQAGAGVVTAGSGLVAVMFGSAACLGCLAAVFGFLGFGTLAVLLGFQTPILIAGLLVTIASIYFVSGSIAKNCADGKCYPTSP